MSTPRPEPDKVDEASDESFPASDPPSWEPLHTGSPDVHLDHASSETDTHFTGSIPDAYDRYLGPLLFEPFAKNLASHVEMPSAALVLELACGTGRLTRHLRARLPSDGHLVATDLYDTMLITARARLGADPRIEFRQADATSLPFSDNAFDAVACQFGVMFFADRLRAAHEVFRVLKPGGTFVFNVWDAMAANPMARIADTTIARFFEHDPPDFYRIPYGFFDDDALRALLTNAGFTEVTIEFVARTGETPTARDAAIGFVRGNPIVTTIRERGTADVAAIEEGLAEAFRRELGDRPMRAPMRAKVVRGRRPGTFV